MRDMAKLREQINVLKGLNPDGTKIKIGSTESTATRMVENTPRDTNRASLFKPGTNVSTIGSNDYTVSR